MSKAVHFHGIENIVQAFRNKGVPMFAVVSDKLIIHKNDTVTDIEEAADNLETFLEMLNQASNAVYTLRIFESVTGEKIKDNTPADYGLNFKLNLPDMLPEHAGRQRYYESRSAKDNELLSEIKALHARLDKIEEEPEEEEEPQGIAGVMNATLAGILNNPEVQQMIAGKLVAVAGNLFGGSKPAAIAGVPDTNTPEENEEIGTRLTTALETLVENTPGGAALLCTKLEKLAAMSVSNSGQYQMLLKML